MREIEGSPFALAQRRVGDVAAAQVEQRIALRPRELFPRCARFRRRPRRRPGHVQGQLSEPRAEIDDPFSGRIASSRMAASFIRRFRSDSRPCSAGEVP